MNCREARADIALYAGGDLDDRARVRELRQHVAACPECQQHYQSLKSTLKTLAGAAPIESGGSTWRSAGSLWPAIRGEISRPPEPWTVSLAFNRLKPWAPFAAMTAACVLMLVSLGHFHTAPSEPVSPRGVLPQGPPIALQTPHDEPPKPHDSDPHGRPLHATTSPAF